MKDRSRLIANHLLKSKAVKLSPEKPFQWASGWLSPIYCDNRITLSFPEMRSDISDGLIELIREKFGSFDVIAGVATAGIPQSAIIADRMQKPMAYVRPNPKSHGMKNQIEGRIEKGAKCIVVEDLISTGGSSLKAVDVLREEGVEVLGLVAIFTYGFDVSVRNFKNSKVDFYCLSNYEILIQEALESGYIETSYRDELNNWRRDPDSWKK
jgi:orotate phosphoribosyltransferase